MSVHDFFRESLFIPAGSMIITTPSGREINGHGPSAFMDMWMKAVQPPAWEARIEPPEMQGIDIVLIQTKPSYGKRHAQTGSMRQKKHHRHAALHQLPYRTTKLIKCHPVMMGMDSAASAVSDETVIDLSFHYDAVKKA